MSTFDSFSYNRLGQLYTASNQAGKTITLINTSTATGFILSNPYGSGKKVAIISAEFNYTVVPTATAIVFLALSVGPSSTAHATTTGETVYAADGSGASNNNVARVYSISTTPNLPVYTMALGYAPTTPATTGGLSLRAQVDGAIILVPGAYAQISYITTAPVGITAMVWAEF